MAFGLYIISVITNPVLRLEGPGGSRSMLYCAKAAEHQSKIRQNEAGKILNRDTKFSFGFSGLRRTVARTTRTIKLCVLFPRFPPKERVRHELLSDGKGGI